MARMWEYADSIFMLLRDVITKAFGWFIALTMRDYSEYYYSTHMVCKYNVRIANE